MTADFVAKLRRLNAKNSQNELSIEKCWVGGEEAFFNKVKDDKRSSAASLGSQHDSFYSEPSRGSFYSTRTDCKRSLLLIILYYSYFRFSSVV